VTDAVIDSGVTDELLAACVHCGFCVPVCPTWDILREENDSPRGRLYLMRAEAEGRVDPSGAFSIHLGRCLGCRACESVCPAGVPFGHLLERARARIPPRPEAGWRERWTLAALTEPRFARYTYVVARALRSSGLARLLARIVPGKVGQALGLLAATQPAFSPAADSETSRGAGAQIDDEASTADYALLEGCVMEGLFAHVHDATRRTLARAGYREFPAPEQACCGALHAHAGLLEEARDLARQNIQAFENSVAEWIVTDSAGCGAGIKDYPAWFADDPEWRERAELVAARVRDVTELLAGLSVSREPAVEAEPGREIRVAYDAPCHLHHGQGIRDAPLEVLRAVPGLEVECLPSYERCCGGAGLYNLTEPELAHQVRAPKLAEAVSGNFDFLATGNPGCIMYLGAGLARSGNRIPVVHPVELVDLAGS
jgi:glycolate oxidase iron-sulfur subunit